MKLSKSKAIAEQYGDWHEERFQLERELDTFDQWRQDLEYEREMEWNALYGVLAFSYCASCGHGNVAASYSAWCPTCDGWHKHVIAPALMYERMEREESEKVANDQKAAWLSGQIRSPGWAA